MEPQRLMPVVRYYGSNGGSAEATPPLRRERVATTPALPPDRRLSGPTLAAFAALAGVLAIGLGAWSFVASSRTGDEPEARPVQRTERPIDRWVLTLLAKSSTERIALRGSMGRIVLAAGERGRAALVLDGLGAAPAGRSYQAWVTRPGASRPASAAVFSGRVPGVPLRARVLPGTTVAVTLEQRGGAAQPTRVPRLVARYR